MTEDIKITDNNCIVKAFENNPIAILQENLDNKKIYYFKGSDIGKALHLTNIRQSIQSYDDDEKVVRKAYDPQGTLQDTVFLTSQGVYRLLYNSKKEAAKKFRKWAGNILDDIIFNESNELKRQLQEKDQLLIEKEQQIEQLENKPETYGFERISGYVYFVEDTTKPGHIKLGYATTPNDRVSSLNVGSSTYSLKILATFETFDKEFAEKIIHYSLNPFRIKNRKEWFYFKNDNEKFYALNTIKNCIEYIKHFDITDIKVEENLNLEEFLIELNKENVEKAEKIKEIQKEKQKVTNKTNAEKGKNRSGSFKGTTFAKDKQLWKAEVQHNSKRVFLGYHSDEIDAAKVYNDYVLFLNETEKTNFLLNDIPGYITIARNVPELNKIKKENKLSSKYNGVSYDSKRKFFVSSITFSRKIYNLGNNKSETECAKLYNQQALFFNNTSGTKYILNEIENYVTIPKDIRTELIEKKQDKKTSKYYGVSLNRIGKWVSSYTLNRKKVHIGTFKTELEACEAYNKTVIELNKNGTSFKVNTF
jgi:prophage antirepressor-like protein